MKATPDRAQFQRWVDELGSLQEEIEEVYGEPEQGVYDHKLPTLVLYAWQEARSELRRLAEPSVVE